MDKQALKARMLELELAELQEDLEAWEDFCHASELQPGETVQHDADSRAEQAGDLALAMQEGPVAAHRAKIEILRHMEFGPRNTVGEGAAVKIDGRWLVVSVATTGFSFRGEQVMGISASAPIYAEMEGLAAGDRFTLGGRERVIEAVA